MTTKFSSLVKLKKNKMQKSEELLQKANIDLNSATKALEESYSFLGDFEEPQSGSISQLIASKTLLSAQRDVIEHNKSWIDFAQNQVRVAKQQLKTDMIEYEKFKYLETQEIKKMLDAKRVQEMKDLDEIALITFGKNKF